MSLFVVFEEGGLFYDLPLSGWLSAWRTGVPIMGVRVGRHRWLYDRILRRYGQSGFRASRDYI